MYDCGGQWRQILPVLNVKHLPMAVIFDSKYVSLHFSTFPFALEMNLDKLWLLLRKISINLI